MPKKFLVFLWAGYFLSVSAANVYGSDDTNLEYDDEASGELHDSNGSNYQNEADMENNAYNNDVGLNDNGGQNSNGPSNSYHQTNRYPSRQLVKVIPQPVQPTTLNEIYNVHDPGQRVLLYLNFACDYNKWNPRNNASLFRWADGAFIFANASADNALFQTLPNEWNYNSNKNCGESSNRYGENNNVGGDCRNSYVKLSSLPLANDVYNEGFVRQKADNIVGATRRIVGRLSFSCELLNVDENPYPKELVRKAQNDPRFGTCQIEMLNADGGTPDFYIGAVNEGVWAMYVGDTFKAKRLVAKRERYDSIVDAAIEYDKRLGVVNYYINGYLVWTINAIGVPPPNDGITKIDYGITNTSSLITMRAVKYSFGTAKCVDESDPNNQQGTIRLVRVGPFDTPYYGPDAVFWDPNATHSNIVFGQGAIQKLYKMIIIEAESKPLVVQREVLPGVYGS